MVASDKIEAAKNCFNTISKSGRNNYQNFQYSELSDITPIVRKICEEYKLKTKFDWDWQNNLLTLTITDREDGSKDVSVIPVAPITANDPGKYMQDIGRVQTYARRYLYIQVFDIAVPDEIDNKDQSKVTKQKPVSQPKPKPKPKQVEKEVKPEEPPSEERVKEILDLAYERVVLEAGKEFNLASALWTLKQLCNSDAELNACKEALKLYTADKVKE